jgi:transcription antitermination factor NusG
MESQSRRDPWLVLRTKSRHEHVVANVLQQKCVDNYLPKCKVTRSSRQRGRSLELPLFPGYVFVRPRVDQYAGMRYIRGSCGFVLAGGRPATLPQQELDAVKRLIDHGAALTVNPQLVEGTRVRIDAGPFAGVEGELVSIRNEQHLVINVDVVGSSVRVKVDRDMISVA